MSIPLVGGQLIQMNITGSIDGQRVYMTSHYIVGFAGSPPVATVADALAQFEISVWGVARGTLMNRVIHQDAIGIILTAQVIAGTGARSVLDVLVPTITNGGWLTGSMLPSGSAMVLRRIGGLAGHAYRGRVYTFGLPSEFVLNSSLDPANNATYTAAASTLKASLLVGTAPNQWVLAPCLSTRGAIPTAAQRVLSVAVNPAVRYQRRREVGVGI